MSEPIGDGLGVIFDMDGVLVDSYRAHFEAWRKVAAVYSFEDFGEELFASTFGRTSRDIIHNLWGNVLSGEEMDALDEKKEQFYRDIIAANFPEMTGASQRIRALDAAGFVLAVGSSGPPANVQVCLEALPAGDLISATVTGRDVTHGKPHPEVFLKAAEKLGLEPSQCAVVEDAPAGIEAARRAKMAAIAITGTAGREKLSQAHIVIDSLDALDVSSVANLIECRPCP